MVVEAIAFAYCQLVPSCTLNNSVLDVSSQDSPLGKLVMPVGSLLGWVEPTCIGPTLIKPVLGEATLSAKNNPGSPEFIFTQSSPALNLVGNGLSFNKLDHLVRICIVKTN